MMSNELTLEARDYDMAFTEISFLLDMFVNTIVTFVGKSTPALAVAPAGGWPTTCRCT